ncbi:MAG TPA: carboxypeptidase-like regulatory domain-containing protein [Candidatus Binatia bacterium]|nr:carboxypeptidase-like regulatory domain-containing protein [Candidatus Binatia bacterium]
MKCLLLHLLTALLALLILSLGRGALAQQTGAGPQPLFGQITGQVFCQDSGLPARFATVQLLPEKSQQSPQVDPAKIRNNPDFAKELAKAMAAAMKGSSLSTVTGIDGNFSLDKVPPGIYYLIPQLPGYRSPLSGLSQTERMKADADTVTSVESISEKIVVAGGTSTSVKLVLERGATLGGKVIYDDGSPAPGVMPTLLMLQKDGKWKELWPLSMLPAITDDRGEFRFYGLPPGKFAVKATLPVSQPMTGLGATSVALHMNPGDALVVYQGGALREKEIKPIELGDGEHRDGIEVIFPVNGLHSISGSVVAKFDKHAVNSGIVELEDPEIKTAIRTAIIGEDGTFKLSYVPEGRYVLKATAADTEPKSGEAPAASDFGRMLNSKTIRSYSPAEMPLLITEDVNGITLQVPDQK